MINACETEDGVVFDMSELECDALRSYADGFLADPAHPFVEVLRSQGLVVGAPAHVTLVDATTRVTVDPAKQWTRSTNCPFRGMELPGQVRYTIFNGVPTVVDATPIAKEDR